MSDNNNINGGRKRKWQDGIEHENDKCGYEMPSPHTKLFNLLNFDPFSPWEREKFDGDAVIKELQINPNDAQRKYTFAYEEQGRIHYPLNQAIMLGASRDVVNAFFRSDPESIKRREWLDYIPLHIAIKWKAPLEVVSFILENCPSGISSTRIGQNTPLHHACKEVAPVEVVSLILDKWPGDVKERNCLLDTPLHVACLNHVQLEVVTIILKMWPDGVKVKGLFGNTPLHLACWYAPLEVVSFLLQKWPQAAREKNCSGMTPLHKACKRERFNDSSLEVIKMLLERWPGATMNKDKYGKSPLSIARKHASVDVQNIISYVHQLSANEADHGTTSKINKFFAKINWRAGVLMVLNEKPNVAYHILGTDIRLMPMILSLIGSRYNMGWLGNVISNKHELIPDI